MNTSGAQYDRWKQATSKELQSFLKTAWKEPTPELRAPYLLCSKEEGCHATLSVQLEAHDRRKEGPRTSGRRT